MHFTEDNKAGVDRRACVLSALAAATLAACGSSGSGSGAAASSAGGSRRTAPAAATTPQPNPPTAAPGRPSPAGTGASDIMAPSFTGPARTWTDYRLQAARHLVRANPTATYTGKVPDPLLAIPVLEVNLHADGSIQSIRVERYPRQARDTVDLATAAVRRAAPFPAVGHLPKPWRFVEVFLFDDNRKFKPRTLD